MSIARVYCAIDKIYFVVALRIVLRKL